MTTTEATTTWEPSFSPWRHGGWYVDNVRYASGAAGCVSRNYADRKWRIVCDDRPDAHERHTYPSRDAAARAERALAMESLDALADCLEVLDNLTSDDFALGRDRGVRRTLVAFLHAHGHNLDADVLREYGIR